MEALQRGFEQTGVTQLHEKYICATIKLLHIVVMTTLGQCRSGFKRLQKTTEGDGAGKEESQEQTGEKTDGAERVIGFAWRKFVG